MNMRYQSANGKVPVYVGVYNALYSDIMNGVYLENEVLPGETVLAEHYGVSRNTLRQALAILSEDGLIIRSQGKGTLVAPRGDFLPADKISNLMVTCSRKPVSKVDLQYNYGPPTDIARSKLGLSRSDLILAGDAVFKVGEDVVGYSFTQVSSPVFTELGVDLGEADSVEHLIIQQIFEHADSWNLSIKLVFANEMEAGFLEIEEATPLLHMEAILYNKAHQSFARCTFYFLPDHYQLQFQV